MSAMIYKPGYEIGHSVVTRRFRGGAGGGVLRCECGRLRRVSCIASCAQAARLGLPVRCRPCESKSRVLPRICRTCRETRRRYFHKERKTECMACERRGHRNGRHSCGCAIRKVGGSPRTTRVIPCRHGNTARVS